MSWLIIAVIALAGATTYQFFHGRRINLLLMRHYLGEIEKLIKPEDRNYVWSGGYVGYRAYYRKGSRKYEFILTLLPRQSLLYFPISLITSRHDKLILKVSGKYKKFHAVQKGYFRSRKFDGYTEISAGGAEFSVRGSDAAIERFKKTVDKLEKHENIKEVELGDTAYLMMKPDVEISNDLKAVLEFIESLEKKP